VSTSLNGSPYHPHLDAFNASLSLEGGNPYAYITIPALDAAANATIVVDQPVAIADLKAFTDYNIALLQNEKINIAVRGSTSLHEMKFPTTTVDFNKIVTINGMRPCLLPQPSRSPPSPKKTSTNQTPSQPRP